MIRTIEDKDLFACGSVYAKAFLLEHWGIDWTGKMLKQHPDAMVLHIGCGLDSRCVKYIVYMN